MLSEIQHALCLGVPMMDDWKSLSNKKGEERELQQYASLAMVIITNLEGMFTVYIFWLNILQAVPATAG